MEPDKKWYQKKRYVIPLVILGLIVFSSSNKSASTSASPVSEVRSYTQNADTETLPSQDYVTPPTYQTDDSENTTDNSDTTYDTSTYTAPSDDSSAQTDNSTDENNDLSNDSYYTNVDQQEVHSPAYSESGEAPDGASAQCGDGTYSFSMHHSGTCSHHGGVSDWLN